MDSGLRFHDAKDSHSSSGHLTLNRLEGSDGCNGNDGRNGNDGCDCRRDEFYRYTRLWQPNDTLTRHIRDDYRQQFGRSSGQHRHHEDEFGSKSTLACDRSDLVTGQPAGASQADQYKVWYLDCL